MSICNLSLQVIPIVPEKEIYQTVDKVIEFIKNSGLKYTVGPMETTIEGELDDLLNIVKEAQLLLAAAGVNRICSIVKIDYSAKGVTIDEKIYKYKI